MAKVKNPFKKQSITDTLINTAIGGAGNVVFNTIWDYLPESITTIGGDGDTVKNAIKLVGGAVAGSMVSNRYLRAMTDGFAVVGASELVSGLIGGALSSGSGDGSGSDSEEPTSGLPKGTIGRIRRAQYGSRKFAKSSKVAGLADFMGE